MKFFFLKKKLKKYFKFILNKKNFKIKKIKNDIKKGIYFNSNIPEGYGIGSSGALVASIYNRYYCNKKIINKDNFNKNNILELKKILSDMESFFHKKSSGLDPLVSFLDFPLLWNNKKKKIYKINLISEISCFIINSGKKILTSKMVNFFLNKIKNNKYFRNIFKNNFLEYTNNCIENYSKHKINDFFKNIKLLSLCTLQNFKNFIPNNIKDIWKEGILKNEFYIKLCGSGGGGYFILFTKKKYSFIKKKLKYFSPKKINFNI
ncbi:mevalonate kinase [Candidatus Shikimatogenerans silvanidophilus]|uniref:GHMP family kinase ATP-binding protein n=1 Tax=Candidatus Shikimatogenerans silvanidophilus TaxID=2782547 RepID=UPI001BAD5B6E|nr:mevalonate kinase [Candidatus Shikimatogenerans silvanidophilus]